MKTDNLTKLIQLAQKDLSASKLLLEIKDYSNSYYHFQQASEKGIKALAVIMGITDFEGLKKFSHNQEKPFKKLLGEVLESLETALSYDFSRDIFREMVTDDELQETVNSLKYSLQFIDRLKQKDLVNIPLEELEELMEFLISIRDLTIETDEIKIEKEFIRQHFQNVMAKLPMITEDEALKIIEFIDDIINNPQLLSGVTGIFNQIGIFAIQLIKCKLILGTTAYITLQHNNKTRYVIAETSPLDIYTEELPIIQKQPQFLNYLDFALEELHNVWQMQAGLEQQVLAIAEMYKVLKKVS